MPRSLAAGAVAGAAGTVALNVSTYLDMAIRGRPSSSVPAKVAARVASRAGFPYSPEDVEQGDPRKQHRLSGMGALMGYGTGLGVGTMYGLLHPLVGRLPVPLTAVLLGAAAMASSDIPSVRMGVTDPSKWGTTGWLSDIIPHLAYGLVTVMVFEMFREDY